MASKTVRSVKLPQLLSLLPKDGVSSSVYQSRWQSKGLPVPTTSNQPGTCRWEVKKTALSFSEDGELSAKAWGVLYWKDKRVTPENVEFERIKGGLKYGWSAAQTPPILAQPRRKAVVEEPVVEAPAA